MAMFSDLKERVLNYVNKIRSRYGVEPLAEMPKGIRSSASSCPIANALTFTTPEGIPVRTEVNSNRLVLVKSTGGTDEFGYPLSDLDYVDGPQYLNEFIMAFDKGQIPSLVTGE